ncbi:MAG TPA: RGCVC family protein [Blastococcus sp.]|nr:RGCVC family protein [Blastococcus sp.]
MSATPFLAEAPAVPPVGAGTCGVCPHALADHDRISLRFCQATASHGTDAATTRGCVCPS